MNADEGLISYVLRLGDTALVTGQRRVVQPRSQRGEPRPDPQFPTIFDRLAEFDQLADSADGQQRHHHPR